MMKIVNGRESKLKSDIETIRKLDNHDLRRVNGAADNVIGSLNCTCDNTSCVSLTDCTYCPG